MEMISRPFAVTLLCSRPFVNRMGLRRPSTVPFEYILAEVAQKHGVTTYQLMGRQRGKRIAHARHEAWWRASRETGMSLSQIALACRMHHTSVMYGVRAHVVRMGT